MTALNPSKRLVRSATLPKPSTYVQLMNGEFSEWVINEDQAPKLKGGWRTRLALSNDAIMDLEIGTGNGYFFADYCRRNPNRNLLGMELKFKPLIQTIKRSLALNNKNGWSVRYHAGLLNEVFELAELNNVFIYFPDPWPKKRHNKNRLINTEFLKTLYQLQKPGSYLEIKTDHPGYFEWILEHVPGSPYKVSRQSFDLHNSEWAAENFMTHFEKLWTGKGLKTHYLRLERQNTEAIQAV